MSDLYYNGQTLQWKNIGSFKATSGMPGYQHPSNHCMKDRGPVPEGQYYIPLFEGGYAKDDGGGICQLKPSWQLQKIPRGIHAGECEPYWANWGYNRVRFEPSDLATKNICRPHRGGFYLHDSEKGYSHGCIEVETDFFTVLRRHIRTSGTKKLLLSVNYIKGEQTNGGTAKG